MQHNKNTLSDLEYLSELGYNKVSTNSSDIEELRAKIRAKTFSINTGSGFILLNLMVGMFMGIAMFSLFYTPQIEIRTAVAGTSYDKTIKKATAFVELDTVKVMGENFTLNAIKPLKKKIIPLIPEVDTIENITSISSQVLNSIPETITEDKILYIPNASVVFLHDLKITNYSMLYFKRNKFIEMPSYEGVDPSFANKDERAKYANLLLPEDSYYLHQAISDAMLYFSKKEYSRCLNILKMISEINPNDLNCRFYSGMCYYYKKDYKSAIYCFNDCISSSNNSFLNEAQYYKGVSLYESGNKEMAKGLFKQISAEGGFYSQKAILFLN